MEEKNEGFKGAKGLKKRNKLFCLSSLMFHALAIPGRKFSVPSFKTNFTDDLGVFSVELFF
jgi:hypothetical protein